jgi:ribosomal protein S21
MLKELRERKTYEKPSVKRRMTKKKAIYTQKFRESSGE